MAGTDPYGHITRRINGDVYLGELAAQEFIGRGRTQLWTWRKEGLVIARQCITPDGRRRWLYSRGSLKAARREMERRKAEQVHLAGPGRGYKGERSAEELAAAREKVEAKRAEVAAERAAALAERRRREREAEAAEDALYAR